MHKLLKYQLDALSIKKDTLSIPNHQLKKLFQMISTTYHEHITDNTMPRTLMQTVFQEATEGIIIEDAKRYVIQINDAMEKILGIPKAQLIGKHSNYLSDMISLETQESIYTAMLKKGSWQGEVEVHPDNSKTIQGWLTLDAIMDKKNALQYVLIMITDISKLYESKNKMEYLASYDSLTNLPNRSLLFKQLKQSISSMERKNSKGMLLFIDIDHFKEFNDNYGHHIGDQVLRLVAKKITSICREEDILGRLSGDEFLLISEDINDQNAINTIIHKIQDIFKHPQNISNLSLDISISIGVVFYPKDAHTPEMLINAADQAMYSVKKSGRNNYAFYSQQMSDTANEYFFIQNALKDAIRSENFTLVYQPQYSLQDNTITGIEVLLRCTHSRIRDIPIERLISIAENSGLINKISYIVLNMVCIQLYKWELLGLHVPPVAVNLSRKELHAKNLIITIHNALSQYNLSSNTIELEITESAFLHESDIVIDNITRLQKLGYTFALDDYGTGFSSLANIKTFQFDKLKIDKSFIDNLPLDKDDQVIVSATIRMAKELGLTVIAEGVETESQVQILKSFGCDIVQGFFYSKPLLQKDIEKLLLKSSE
ncbi:MAG TPA: GGDEF and EAL domain-containing protein [Sulfurovum sp.]|nr:GGDEF and EAL domain-containing protein [Sulfurovum sp.]